MHKPFHGRVRSTASTLSDVSISTINNPKPTATEVSPTAYIILLDRSRTTTGSNSSPHSATSTALYRVKKRSSAARSW